MFYCDVCAKKNKWPRDFWAPLSRGQCEFCRAIATCYDVPFSFLPNPPKEDGE